MNQSARLFRNDIDEGIMVYERQADTQIQQLFKLWGRWLQAGHLQGLGFSPETVIGRCMREGAGASQSSGKKPCGYQDELAERMDRIIAKMPHKQKRAVLLYWGRGLPEVAAAACFPTSRYHLRKHLENAERWLEAKLEEQRG